MKKWKTDAKTNSKKAYLNHCTNNHCEHSRSQHYDGTDCALNYNYRTCKAYLRHIKWVKSKYS